MKAAQNIDLDQTRTSLLSSLRRWDDHENWMRFFDTYWKLIYNAAIYAGLSDAEAQDVVQDTVLSVSRKIGEFEYDRKRGTFKGWLLTLTRWRIVDQKRKRRPETVLADGESDGRSPVFLDQLADASTDDLDQFWEREWQRNLVDAAMQRVKRRVNPKAYQLFDLAVVQEWPVPKIKDALKVSAARIYLAKHRITRQVRDEVNEISREYASTHRP